MADPVRPAGSATGKHLSLAREGIKTESGPRLRSNNERSRGNGHYY